MHLPYGFFKLPRNFSVLFFLPSTSGQPAPTSVLDHLKGMPSPGSPAPRRYTVLSMAPGGLRSGRLPLHPRVQLEERGLQRGDFSLWLRPALRADAGEYHAAVRFPDRTLSCHLRLRIGQASSRWGGTKGEGLGSWSLSPRGRGRGRKSCGKGGALDPACGPPEVFKKGWPLDGRVESAPPEMPASRRG